MNAKIELQNKLKEINKSLEDIKCFNIIHSEICCEQSKVIKGINLNLDDLDFEYDEGYGSQHLFGIILFNDGSWIIREEYDGSEWWEYIKPFDCKDIENYFE